MTNTPPKEAPAWLREELFLIDGVFNQDRTVVTGRPNSHASAVFNTGSGAPGTLTVDLTKRADWEAIKKRLADEKL